MNKLLTRILAVGLAAILSFALVTGLVVKVGFGKAVSRIDRQGSEHLVEYIARRLESLRMPDDSSLLEARIAEALHELPASTEYLAVSTEDGRPLYLSRRDRTVSEVQWPSWRKQLSHAAWIPARTSDSTALWFAFKTVHVDMEKSSQAIISATERIAVWGACIAGLVAAIVAFAISRPLSGQARALAGALSAMRDGRRNVPLPRGGVRELREIADSAADLQEGLRREEELRLQWAVDIAHDLRTPLSVLKGQLEGMIDGVLVSDRARLERNYHEVLKLERLVNQLADLSRIESPGYRLDLKDLDVSLLLSAQAQRFAESARARGIKIAIEGRGTSPARVKADAALLERALANLIDNAIRYGDPDSELSLRVVPLGEAGLSFVVDNAGLVDPSDRPHVFDRLYRGDRSRSTAGTGIGLSIAKAIAQAHGGSLALECDEAARRTRFVLSIPA